MNKIFYSLRSRIFFAIAALLVPASLLLSWLAIHQQTEFFEQTLIERGQVFARHMAYGAELSILTKDPISLNSLLHKVMHEKDILYAEIYDSEGTLITASSSSSSAGDSYQDPDLDLDTEQARISNKEEWFRRDAHTYEFEAPVISEIASSDEDMLLNTNKTRQDVIGMVHIALSNQSIQSSINQLVLQGIIVLLLLLAAALVVTWWLAQLLTQQLKQIGDVARKIEDGEFDQRITIIGNDETATLAAALNRMLNMLSEHDNKLHAQQRIMQTILDQAPIGVWMLNIDGKVQFINQSFAHTLGITEQQLLQVEHYKTLLSTKVANQCMESDHICFNSGKVHHSMEQITDAESGIIHSFDIIKAPVHNDQGEIEGLIGLAIDITSRIQAEEEKASMQKQVEHTQRLESLGVLAGGIAHDFNNILTAIMGNAALAERKIASGGSETCGKYMKNIAQSSEKAALLCKQMLAYSGKGHFIIKPLNLTAMVSGITSLLEVSIQRTIQLHYTLPEDIGLIEADEAQVQQVIMNLVINASDAIGEQNGTISIVTGELEADIDYLSHAIAHADDKLKAGRYIFLEVSDSGCGMDQTTQQKLFEPFFTTKFTGRGLGMSAVLGIVRGHHGAMMLYSEIGKGTTFKVLFPVASSSAATAAPHATAEPTPWRGSGTILIVDDEETIRETAASMIEEMGFHIVTACDGLDGVERYRQHQQEIVAILLDMTMPNLDGAGCFLALKKINPQVKVILSSGYNEQDSTKNFDSQALAGFIQKPYWPDALENILRKVLT
ncbi:MAG: response regulator [Mariprofundales bacterium]